MPVYEDILDRLSNQVRIMDAPRRFTRSEVEKLIEIAILEEKMNSKSIYKSSQIDEFKNMLNEKASTYFGYRI